MSSMPLDKFTWCEHSVRGGSRGAQACTAPDCCSARQTEPRTHSATATRCVLKQHMRGECWLEVRRVCLLTAAAEGSRGERRSGSWYAGSAACKQRRVTEFITAAALRTS